MSRPVAAVAALLLAAAGLCRAYTPPPNDGGYLDASANVFLPNEVTRVDVTIAPADFQDLLDHPHDNDFKHTTVRWRNSRIDETLPEVAMRVRGNTSRNAAKKSWKLDFKEFVVDRQFHGLEEANINGDPNDPTILRSMVAWTVARRMGIAAPRTHLVALYINDTFWSLQVHVEHIDEEFAGSWFGDKDGNLYKCLYLGARADLAVVGSGQPSDYANLGGGTTYVETNNDPLSDYTDLANFIGFFNTSSSADIFPELDTYFNVDSFLRYLAVCVGLGLWDNYWFGSNNYYLYHQAGANVMEWIPFDFDNSMGIDYFGTNWSTRDFEDWGDGGFGTQPAPLVDVVFEHSAWRRQYRRYLARVADEIANPALMQEMDDWRELIRPYFDGTIESGGEVGDYFFGGLEQPNTYGGGSGHTMGLKPFLAARAASLQTQLATAATTPPLPRVFVNEVLAANATTNVDEAGDFDDWLEIYNDEDTEIDVGGWYLSDDPSVPGLWQIPAGTTIPSKDFLLVWADDETTEGLLHAAFRLGASGETVSLSWDDANGRVLIDTLTFPAVIPDQSFGHFPDGVGATQAMCDVTPEAANSNADVGCGNMPRTPPRVFINEFMASNLTTVQDEIGEFADWVELYNDEDAPVDLTGMHLTDNLAIPAKFEFPPTTIIPAKGFVLIWCDNDVLQGPLHTGFSLLAAGEELGLFDNDANQLQPIHTFAYSAQAVDVSEGLLPDGVGTPPTNPAPVVQFRPTPGASNFQPPTTSALRLK